MPLTKAQCRLVDELRKIADITGTNFWDIETVYPQKLRVTALAIMKDKMVRGEIIFKYTYIDELLTMRICEIYFPIRRAGQTFQKMWRTKQFRHFVHYMLDDMYLLEKMRVIHAFAPIPSKYREIIARMNALRNALAHSFFPQNRREYMEKKKVIYCERDIFSSDGLRIFGRDFQELSVYLQRMRIRSS